MMMVLNVVLHGQWDAEIFQFSTWIGGSLMYAKHCILSR